MPPSMHLDCRRSLDSCPKRFTPTSPRRSNKPRRARTFEHHDLPTIGPTRRTKQNSGEASQPHDRQRKLFQESQNLHKATIKMILFAAAMDNEEVPDDVTDSCKRFVNSKSVALMEQELNQQFETRGMNEVSFATGYMANISCTQGLSFGQVATPHQATTRLSPFLKSNQSRQQSTRTAT